MATYVFCSVYVHRHVYHSVYIISPPCVLHYIYIRLYFTRRIRELNENNTKKFIEERKRQAVLQSRQIDLLKKLHVEQSEILGKDSQRVSWLLTLDNSSFECGLFVILMLFTCILFNLRCHDNVVF